MGGWVTLNGNATYDTAAEHFILGQDAQGQKGALMSNERIDLRSDFDLSFDLYLGNKDAAGADGMAFVLHNDPFGGDATGRRRRFPWRLGHPLWRRHRVRHLSERRVR